MKVLKFLLFDTHLPFYTNVCVFVQIAGLLGVLWCVSLLSCLFSYRILVPMQANPLALYGLFLLFLINPFKTCYYKSRFWLLKLLVTSPTST